MFRALSRFAAVAAAFAFLTFAGAAQAKAAWTRGETKHFIFYSSGRSTELERFAIETEKFDAMLRLRFNVPEDEITTKLTIYVLPDAKAVSALAGVPPGRLAGFYQAADEGSFAVSNRDRPQNKYDQSGQQVLFHEYTHHFFARYLPSAYPVWLFEGFAEYYSTTTFKSDGTFTMGAPVWGRAYGLIEGQRMPLRDILFSDVEGLDLEQGDIFYGRSWLLTHKFMSTPEGLNTLAKYITDLNNGVDPKAAAESNFGDLDKLDRAVEAMEKGSLTTWISKLPVTFDADYKAAELDEVQSRLVELQLQRRAAKDKAPALDGLRTLAAAYPDRSDVLYELAQAEYDLAKQTEDAASKAAGLAGAETDADRVLALDKDHVRANVLKAEAMLDRKDADISDEDYAAARKFLARANRADPADPLPLYLYFRTYAESGRQAPEIALAGLEQSFLRAKEVTDFRVTLAFAYANEGRFDDALALVQYLVNDPHGGGYGKRMLETLAEMKQRAAARDANWKVQVEEGDGSDSDSGS